MRTGTRALLVLVLASVAATPPLLASRAPRNGDPASDRGRPLTPAERGDQSEPGPPGVVVHQSPALRDAQPRIAPFCEPVPEKFFISSLESIATDIGTAGYVIDKPGHYILTRDLEVPAVDIGILVRGHGVVLDLRGHTLSDREGESVLIAVDRSRDTSIMNGVLKGGAAAIDAFRPNDGSATEHLDIRRIRVFAHASSERYSVTVTRFRRVNIKGMEVSGGSRGVSILGTSRSRIVDSRIEATQEGLRLSAGIRLLRSWIKAPDAVVVDGGQADLTGNRIIGGATGAAALRIAGGFHKVRHNRIQAAGAGSALVLNGESIVQSNEIRGGSEAVVVNGRSSRLTGNKISADVTGIRVAGSTNLIEGNLFTGAALQCGISFEGSRENVYRDNTLEQGSVCGEPNIDGGGNSTGSCAGIECEARRSPISPLVLQEEDEDRFSGAESSAPPCGPGDIVTITDLNPVETQYGTVGLLIDGPGYYQLANDLHATENYAIVITGRDVTLDLSHHVVESIDGYGPLLIVGSENVVIRNGEMRGGGLGLNVIGDAMLTATGLRLEKMWLWRGDTSGYQALRVENVRRVEIIDSHFSATEVHSTITGPTTGIIRGSSISGAEGGLWAYGFNDGVLIDNSIGGDYSLSLGSRNLLRRNDIGAASLGARNTIEDALFHGGQYGDDGLRTDGEENVIRDSRITGVVTLSSARNLLVDTIVGNGIEVRGESNSLENNFITGGECGVELETDAAHVYRNNVIVDADEGFCGFPNLDAGGNIVPSPTCGNGVKSVQEICEAPETIDSGCSDLGFESGVVVCNAACDGFDESGCHTCGDGVRGGWEACDGDDLRGETCVSQGFEGGVLSCTSGCGFDRSGCIDGCGNGVLEEGEVCESPGAAWAGDSCEAYGYGGGFLVCNGSCNGFQFTYCVGGCGNGQVEANEQCDGDTHMASPCWRYFDYHCTCRTFGIPRGASLGCTDDCTFDFSPCGCGNGILDPWEVCDTDVPVTQTCASQGFTGGVLACGESCMEYDVSQCTGGCGNGVAEGEEQCDGHDHRNSCPASGCRCEPLGLGTGRLGCSESCVFDASNCVPPGQHGHCGNGRVETGEFCDGADLAGRTCMTQGFDAGAVQCLPDCTLDLRGCIGDGTCGDGMKRGAEECDGQDHGTVGCQSFGHASGYPSCTDDCHLDPTNCSTCGNGILEGREGCDGTDLGGQTCGSVGKPWGTLSCTSICTFNTSGCIGF